MFRPLIGTNFPKYTFLARFKPQIYIELLSPKLKLNVHLTKSPKRDHIYKLCLYPLEEHKCLILTFCFVPKLKYSTHAKK